MPPAVTEEKVLTPEQLRMTEAFTRVMSKELAHLIAGQDLTRARPPVYKGSEHGICGSWLLLKKCSLECLHAKSTKTDRAWTILDHLEGEPQKYIINMSEAERDESD